MTAENERLLVELSNGEGLLTEIECNPTSQWLPLPPPPYTNTPRDLPLTSAADIQQNSISDARGFPRQLEREHGCQLLQHNISNPQQTYPPGFGSYAVHGDDVMPVTMMPESSEVITQLPLRDRIDYTILSIIICIFLLQLLGLIFCIISLVYSMKARKQWRDGDSESAERSTKSAKRWRLAGLLVAFIVVMVVTVIALYFQI